MKRLVVMAAGLMSLAIAAPSSAASGDVGLWHFDEGSGVTVADASGHGNNGTLEGNAQWVVGRFGTALQFDGATSRVHVTDNASLEPPTSVSISAWFKRTGSPGDYRYIVAKGASDCIAASYGLYSGPDGGLQFYVSMDHGTSYVRSPDAGTGVWDGQWHMAVGTFDGTDVKLYVDGQEVGAGTSRSGPLEYLLADSNDLFIGDYPGCQLHHKFAGAIDEVAVWDRALAPAEVKSRFNQANQQPALGGAGTPGDGHGGTGPTSPSGSGGPPGTVGPALHGLKISPSAFALVSPGHSRSSRLPLGTTISYANTQGGRSTLTAFYRHAGWVAHGRCTVSAARQIRRHRTSCFLYTRVGSFTHIDRVGSNSFRFSGIRGIKFKRGKYRLDVTPRSGQRAGKTVSVFFSVIG